MSSAYQQRWLLRMLFDPTLLDRIVSGDVVPEEWSTLSSEEQEELRSIDPRVLRTDPHRQARHLQGMLAEFPLSVLYLGNGKPWKYLQFYTVPDFHTAVHQWTSQLDAFAGFLRREAPPEMDSLLNLEIAISQSRRDLARTPFIPDGMVQLAPGVSCVQGPENLGMQYHQTLEEEGLKLESPLDRLTRPPRSHWNAPVQATDWVLIHCQTASGVILEDLPRELGELLQAVVTPQERAKWMDLARQLGADSDLEAQELLADLVEDGLMLAPL